MTIAIGSDHAGFSLKEHLKAYLNENRMDLPLIDVGTKDTESVDYPDYAKSVSTLILSGAASVGVLICGSGIGIGIAANRFRGIRAAQCMNPEMAKLARQHNDANILVLGQRLTDPALAEEILDMFLNSQFEGGRHERRVQKLDTIS